MGNTSRYFLAGAVAFAAAQAVLFFMAEQSARPTIDGVGWFLNSGTGIAVMAAVVAVVSLIVSKAFPPPLWRGLTAFVGGGVLALAAAVFLFGPGSIFPIVIAAGAVEIAVAALAGAWGARLLQWRSPSR
jgi:hypothetical protein